MQYALLAYAPPEDTDRATRPISGTFAARLDRPNATGWARLHADESATTLRNDEGRMLLTDGPFIDSKEYLAGLILIEADNLDRALAIAEELLQLPAAAMIRSRETATSWCRASTLTSRTVPADFAYHTSRRGRCRRCRVVPSTSNTNPPRPARTADAHPHLPL
jgi:hypothetical protein